MGLINDVGCQNPSNLEGHSPSFVDAELENLRKHAIQVREDFMKHLDNKFFQEEYIKANEAVRTYIMRKQENAAKLQEQNSLQWHEQCRQVNINLHQQHLALIQAGLQHHQMDAQLAQMNNAAYWQWLNHSFSLNALSNAPKIGYHTPQQTVLGIPAPTPFINKS